ncbi:NOD1 protein, partial [Amia calva]|nr:NOD1 protein [Amia calva]
GIVKLLSGLAELQTPQDREQMTTRSQEAEDRQNLTLLELDIGGNQMTSEGLGVVASFLRQCPLLQYLGLAKSNVADTAGWADLFDSLKTKTSIGHIILDENYLGDEGAKLFAEMLKLNASLCKVDLDSNGIGDDGGNAIFEALLSRTGGPLEHLSLEGNFISDNLLTRIHEQLKPNPT